jgi:hypothetical protein
LTGGTAAISGVVVDAMTGRPVHGAVVSLVGSSGNVVGGAVRQLTGKDGQFVFTSLPTSPGYLVGATKFGFLDGGYGRKTPQSTTRRIALTDGQWFSDARIQLWRPGSINGVVVDEANEPIVGAYVRLMPQLLIGGQHRLVAGPAVKTDDRGVYRFPALLPGRYFVYVPSVQWAVPTSTSLLTLSGKTPENVANAEAAGRDAGLIQHPLVPLSDRMSLAVGTYPTPPPPAGGRRLAYPITFYPQMRSPADALAVDLGYGEAREGIDIQLRPVVTATISGRVEGPDSALTNLTLRLMPAGMEGMANGGEAGTTLIHADGTFTFLNVPSGSYTILAGRASSEYRYDPPGSGASATVLPYHPAYVAAMSGASAVAAAPSGTMLWHNQTAGDASHSARTRVDVNDTDVGNVLVTMRRGITMSGTVVEELQKPRAANVPKFYVLQAEPANGDPTLGQPRGIGEQTADAFNFRIEGLQPGGEYLLRLIGIGLVKSVRWQDRDYTYAPFDTTAGQDISSIVITMTDQSSTIEGLVREAQGGLAANAAVIHFPAERDQWSRYGVRSTRVRSAPVSSSGSYRLASLPAGDYYVIAVDDSASDDWKDPAFLEAAARMATRVTIDWGQTRQIELRVQQVTR